MLKKLWHTAFKPDNLKGGFQASGLYALNHEAIAVHKVAPSVPFTSAQPEPSTTSATMSTSPASTWPFTTTASQASAALPKPTIPKLLLLYQCHDKEIQGAWVGCDSRGCRRWYHYWCPGFSNMPTYKRHRIDLCWVPTLNKHTIIKLAYYTNFLSQTFIQAAYTVTKFLKDSLTFWLSVERSVLIAHTFICAVF